MNEARLTRNPQKKTMNSSVGKPPWNLTSNKSPTPTPTPPKKKGSFKKNHKVYFFSLRGGSPGEQINRDESVNQRRSLPRVNAKTSVAGTKGGGGLGNEFSTRYLKTSSGRKKKKKKGGGLLKRFCRVITSLIRYDRWSKIINNVFFIYLFRYHSF